MLRREFWCWLSVGALVVISSALFVPLAAQARLNRDELCLTRIHTLARAIIAYAQDYDERMPFAFGRASDGRWLWNYSHAVPYDWRSDSVALHSAYAMAWANTILPYLPERSAETPSRSGLLLCPSIQPQRLRGVNYAAAQRRPIAVSYTYNGLLHQLELTQVADPALVPSLWEGHGRGAGYGFSISNPVLRCDRPELPCVYQPRSSTGSCPIQSTMFAPMGSFWIHPQGASFAFVDGHVAWRRLGLVVGSATDSNYDPYTGYNESGIPQYYWWDGCHPWLFRPYTQ
jgi:prepilin-type processing-associated H-X9-DG protein